MALLQAPFAILSRSLGKVLNAVFGWAVIALFGATSPREKTILSGLVALAAAWPVLALGIVFPSSRPQCSRSKTPAEGAPSSPMLDEPTRCCDDPSNPGGCRGPSDGPARRPTPTQRLTERFERQRRLVRGADRLAHYAARIEDHRQVGPPSNGSR